MNGSPEQLAALAALIRHRTFKEAAAAIYVSERTLKSRVYALRDRNRCETVRALIDLAARERRKAA